MASFSMAEGGSECADAQSLQDLFKGGWDVQKRVEKDDLDSTSDEFRASKLMNIVLCVNDHESVSLHRTWF